MSPAATEVFPNSIFATNNNKQQHYCQSGSHSRSSSHNTATKLITSTAESGDTEVLTVWKKSLLKNCNGFTVYEGKGNLVYRVDNYITGNKGEIVLMDATREPLLTIRRKRLSLGDSWMIYEGGEMTANPKLSVRKNVHLLNSKTLAQVTAGKPVSSSSSPKKNVEYEIEGSYTQRSVLVYNSSRRCVAEIRRKEAPGGISLGSEVFSLVLSRSHIDTVTAMGFVILLEEMFGSSASYSSLTRW